MQLQKLGFASLLSAFLLAPKLAQAAPAQVRLVSPQALRSEIARSKGHVVVVNFWATWCQPCVKELPALAQFASRNKGKATLLLVSADERASAAKAAQVAGAKGHRVTRLISSDIDLFFAGFDPKNKDTVSLPRTYIFNRRGQLVKVVTQEQSAAGYQKLIAPYL